MGRTDGLEVEREKPATDDMGSVGGRREGGRDIGPRTIINDKLLTIFYNKIHISF